jgi:hypothetical protein
LDLFSYFILLGWQKIIRLCFDVELMQVKKAFPLLKGRGKKKKRQKKTEKKNILILTMHSFETKYIPLPLS